jgi:uncharacterized membrane protein
MTETPSSAPSPAKPPLPRRFRWLLIASLTLNLLVVGAVVGTALRVAGGGRLPPPAERSLGFGPWSGGLDRDDYRALRRGFEQSGRDLRDARAAENADRQALITALRADPFDPATLDAVAARMQARTLERLEFGQQVIRAHVVAMSPQARRAFADRLERHTHRDHKDRGRGDKTGG